jgi:hypothetical protein
MTIEQIVKVESDNTSKIYLYREGLFLKAYNHSAFLFLKYGKNYEAFRKFFKSVGREVAMLGFPSNILSGLFNDNDCIFEIVDEDFVIVVCPEALDPREYELWLLTLKLKTAKPKSTTTSTAVVVREFTPPATPRNLFDDNDNSRIPGRIHLIEQIVGQIEAFSIENSTPMECMMFVSQLKKELKKGKSGYLREPAGI